MRHERYGDRVNSSSSDRFTLPLAIFNLEPLREQLETLQVKANNMTAFPEQFSRPFGRLRLLDLSDNRFSSIIFRRSFVQCVVNKHVH